MDSEVQTKFATESSIAFLTALYERLCSCDLEEKLLNPTFHKDKCSYKQIINMQDIQWEETSETNEETVDNNEETFVAELLTLFELVVRYIDAKEKQNPLVKGFNGIDPTTDVYNEMKECVVRCNELALKLDYDDIN